MRWGRILLVTLAVVGTRATHAQSADSEASTSVVAIRHDAPGELPTVGDQRASASCVSWAVRTIVAHHYRELASPWRLVRVRVPRWRWSPPFGIQFVDTLRWIWAGVPDLADPSNWPSVTYLHNLALRRTVAPYLHDGETFESCVAAAQGAPLPYALNVATVALTLQQFGAPTENEAPFTVSESELPTPDQVESAESLRRRWARDVGAWSRVAPNGVPTAGDLCAALKAGPALLMMRVYPDFGCGVGEEYEPQPHDAVNSCRGAHAIVVVAFEPQHPSPGDANGTTPAFRLMNSWGPYWGDAGYTWVTADHLFTPANDGARLVTQLHRFDVSRFATCPAQSLQAPAEWGSGDDVPWEGDPERDSCDEAPPPSCAASPTTTNAPAPAPAPYAGRNAPFVKVDIDLAEGAWKAIWAPPVPLVPALLASTVRYWVDGVPAETVDPAKTGLAFHFVNRAPLAVRAPADEPVAGAALAKKSNRPTPDAWFGADPEAIGVFHDRAIFEIVKPSHPYLVGGRIVRVLVEVFDPGASEPRAVARYRIHVGK